MNGGSVSLPTDHYGIEEVVTATGKRRVRGDHHLIRLGHIAQESEEGSQGVRMQVRLRHIASEQASFRTHSVGQQGDDLSDPRADSFHGQLEAFSIDYRDLWGLSGPRYF